MRASLIAGLALTIAAPAHAQIVDDAVAAACIEAGGCRVVDQLRIEGPDGLEEVVDLGITIPWLTQGNIMLTPGEAVTIALEDVEGILVPTLISTGEASRETPLEDGQVRFDFGGYQRGRIMLSVLSQYPEQLDYGALKVTIGLGPDRTSVCTLMPGVAVFETWQEPIYQLALFGFRKAEGYGCKIIDESAEIARDSDG